MPAEKPARFSSLRVVREIEPTTQVVKFIEKVDEIGLQVFGEKDATFVRDRPSRDLDLLPGYESSSFRLPISALTVYPKNGLRLILLERRTPQHTNSGGSFERAKSWVRKNTAGLNVVSNQKLLDIEDDNSQYNSLEQLIVDIRNIEDRVDLKVDCVDVQRTINSDYSILGPEYALRLNPISEVTEYLCDESDFVFNSVKSMPSSTRILYPQAHSGLEVAFARAPLKSSYQQRAEFIGRVVEECLPLPVSLGQRMQYEV